MIASKLDATRTKPSRSVSLDLLRAVAILLVIGNHLVPHLTHFSAIPLEVSMMLESWLDVGWLGVDLFFVLSGFLISGLLFAELRNRSKISIGRFLIRRGFKLYPSYYVFLAYGVAQLAWSSWSQTHGFSQLINNLKQIWPCFLLLQSYLNHYPWGHTWSLAVEEHFYLILPALIAFLAHRQRLHLLVPGGIAVLIVCLFSRIQAVYTPGTDLGAVYSMSHLRIDSLLVGVLLRYLLEFSPARGFLNRVPWKILVSIGLVPFALALLLPWNHALVLGPGLTFAAWGSACLILAATRRDVPTDSASWGVTNVFAWIGRNSYSSYLWHVNVIGWSGHFWLKFSTRTGYQGPIVLMASVLTTVIAVVVFGALMTALIEVPALRLRNRWFPSKSETPAPNAVPTVAAA